MSREKGGKGMVGFMSTGDSGSDDTVCWPVLDMATQIKNQDVPLRK